jgi:hypothetical protein
MIHDGPEQGITNGFVDIATAERLRQQQTVATFREKHEAEYQRLVRASVGLKLAHQELEAAKRAAATLPTGLPIGDLLDGVERDARAQLKEAADRLTTNQLAQVSTEIAPTVVPEAQAQGPGPANTSRKGRAH